jgi:hypothetical protein
MTAPWELEKLESLIQCLKTGTERRSPAANENTNREKKIFHWSFTTEDRS